MRGRRIATEWILILVVAGCLQGCEDESRSTIATAEDRAGYSLGFAVGEDLKEESAELDIELVLRGIRDGLKQSEALLSDEEVEEVRRQYVAARRTAEIEERRTQASKNLAEGERFLQENAQREEVVVLPSGLQYRVIEPGTGARPTPENNVKVHYRGYFIDGTEFGNTYAENRPAVFPVRRVIPGWTEALPMMAEGAKWELFVPSDLAYGEKGAGEIIGPNKMLIFELEFIAIH